MVTFITWIAFILIEQEINLTVMRKYVKKTFCGTVIPAEIDMSEFNHYIKLDKMLYIIYADMESLVKKIDGSTNNPENSSTTKIDEHIPCGCSIWAFNNVENKPTLYCGETLYEKVSFGNISENLQKNI